MKNYFNFAIILFLLIGLPAGSYFYMRDGWNYRVEAIRAQGDFGKMPEFDRANVLRGELPREPRGNMLVVGWLDTAQAQTARIYGQALDSLHTQFDDSPHLYFATLTNADTAFLSEWTARYGIEDDPMLSFHAPPATLSESGQTYQFPGQAGADPLVALVDSSLTIRKFFDLRQRNETIGLVQLISLIIPLPEKADVILDPKKEF